MQQINEAYVGMIVATYVYIIRNNQIHNYI